MIELKDAQEIANGFEVEQALNDHAADPTPDAANAVVRAVAAALTARRRVFPQGQSVGRCGDMAPLGRSHMTVLLDGDCDACVSIWDQETGQGSLAGIEFCTAFGGGKSPRTRDALVALMVAMEEDNASSPRGQWPPLATKTPQTPQVDNPPEILPDAGTSPLPKADAP